MGGKHGEVLPADLDLQGILVHLTIPGMVSNRTLFSGFSVTFKRGANIGTLNQNHLPPTPRRFSFFDFRYFAYRAILTPVIPSGAISI